MKYLLTFLVFFPFLNFGQLKLNVQGDVVNVRKQPEVTSEVVIKVKRFDKLTVLEKGKEATVNGIIDNWYKIETEGGKIGFVFGHFTSWKREGKVTKPMTLSDVSWGDCFHLIFDGIDFGNAINDLGIYEQEIENDSYADDKILVGTLFNVTYNSLFTVEYEYCNPESPAVVIQTPTIVRIEKN
ncbi:MAG: SH3 domain-containing protein [Bacteroidetes bacterium]|nr:SH3 domain-containing protein [Bacteroidota bacterium]